MKDFMLEKYKNLYKKIVSDKEDKITEEDVRLSFTFDIENYIKVNFKKTINFSTEVKLNENSRRVDSKYGNFIIEYKRPTVAIDSKVERQLIEYLNSFAKSTYKRNVWGAIINGKKIFIYEFDNDKNRYSINERISQSNIKEAFLYLCKKLANIENLLINENNINDYFGIEQKSNFVKLFYKKIIKSKNKRTNLLYNEWERLSRLSSEKDTWNTDKGKNKIINDYYESILDDKIDNNIKQYKALFSIQTYYSIVVKMILYKYLTDKEKVSFFNMKHYKDLFYQIETNKFYKNYHILNMIDGDFYSWYVDELSESELEKIYFEFKDVITLKTDAINKILIKFYENIFPFYVRYSMGEYYTPLYLATEVYDNALNLLHNDKCKKILDPTCGSGIFLISAYNSNLKSEIYGIDINPLAVLTSKANLLINGYMKNTDFEIPIYLGDSTYSPIVENINGVSCYTYELLNSLNIDFKIILPEKLVLSSAFFDILDDLEICIKNKNEKMAYEILKSNKNCFYDKLKDKYIDFIKKLISLERDGLNSIWLKIIGNYLKAAAIKNVNLIIGNPP